MVISLENRVAIVTGGSRGLGAAHARALAGRGAKVLINDLGSAAEETARAIRGDGGDVVAYAADVTAVDQVEAMVDEARRRFGSVDILVNNAGILRDKSFVNMDLAHFREVVDVHLMGSVNCAKAVWSGMRTQRYGRIIFTTSSSGLYGNFGQANYSAAKMALVGLMKTLAIEGEKYDVRVNCLSPSAATHMTHGLYGDEKLGALSPDLVAPAVLALSDEEAPTGMVLCAGAGRFEAAHVTLTRGVSIRGPRAAEEILARLQEITDRDGEFLPRSGEEQSHWEADCALNTHAAA
jgi:NAD(P)-dependent dehydrogenase (short-subunit alcohol dehydrogenase family)